LQRPAALNERQLRAVDLLAAGRPVGEVAAELDVDRTTLWRWRQEPLFAAALNGRRLEVWQTSNDRLRALLFRAAEVLEQALDAGDIRVALTLVKLGGASELGRIGSTDAEEIAGEQRQRQLARDFRQRIEDHERDEAEVRVLEKRSDLEMRRMIARLASPER
jgi:hypothetical protein